MDSYDHRGSPPTSFASSSEGMNLTSTFASQSLPAFAPFESHTPAFPTAVHSSAPVPFYSSAPSPRSRTYSTTSSVSSFRSSYLDEASPDNSACTSHPSYDQSLAMNLLLDGNGQGFVVEDSNTGRVLVHWDQLIQFLVNPQTVSYFPQDHPIARAGAFLASLPAPSLEVRTESARLDPSHDDNMAPLSAGLRDFNLRSHDAVGNTSTDSSIYDSPQTAHPFRSNFPHSDPPPLPVPTAELPAIPPFQRSIDPRTFSSPISAPPSNLSMDEGCPSLPVPPARLRRGDSDFGPSSSRRNASSPYARPPFYQQPHLSASSLQDFAGQPLASSAASFRSLNDAMISPPHTRVPTKKDIARKAALDSHPLNQTTEKYAWSFHKSQLVRLPEDAVDGEPIEETAWDENGEPVQMLMEKIVFEPGSYFRCFEQKIEIFPCDVTARGNSFLRAQHCVVLCNFRFESKRPSVIRNHVVSCKARARDLVGPDPLKRLCELQLEAQQVIAKHRRKTVPRIPSYSSTAQEELDSKPFAYSQADESDTGDDRSVYSFDSGPSASGLSARRGRRPPSFFDNSTASSHSSPAAVLATNENEEGEENWWSSKPSNSHDPIQAIVDASSFVARDDVSSSTWGVNAAHSSSHPDWLMNYGLQTPTLNNNLAHQQQQQQRMTLDSPPRPLPTILSPPSHRDSFLAMD